MGLLPKSYYEVRFQVTPVEQGRDILLAILSDYDFESFLETNDGLNAYAKSIVWRQIDIDEAIKSMPSMFSVSYELKEVPLENWNAKWESSFQPIIVGDYTVRAPFHPPKKTIHELIIEPKMSFGTGHHQTTQLMLNYLINIDVKNKVVLDMGCGTGILGILSAQRGAKSVLAVDIEPWCVENTIENAIRNQCEDRVDVLCGDIDKVSGSFDFIIANINRNTLLFHISYYADKLNDGGILLLSGFYKYDLEIMNKRCFDNNLSIHSYETNDDWVCAKYVYSTL